VQEVKAACDVQRDPMTGVVPGELSLAVIGLLQQNKDYTSTSRLPHMSSRLLSSGL